ncbi:hypothetical protein RI367_002593 [Sorochytrium milnesiophthora]
MSNAVPVDKLSQQQPQPVTTDASKCRVIDVQRPLTYIDRAWLTVQSIPLERIRSAHVKLSLVLLLLWSLSSFAIVDQLFRATGLSWLLNVIGRHSHFPFVMWIFTLLGPYKAPYHTRLDNEDAEGVRKVLEMMHEPRLTHQETKHFIANRPHVSILAKLDEVLKYNGRSRGIEMLQELDLSHTKNRTGILALLIKSPQLGRVKGFLPCAPALRAAMRSTAADVQLELERYQRNPTKLDEEAICNKILLTVDIVEGRLVVAEEYVAILPQLVFRNGEAYRLLQSIRDQTCQVAKRS